MRYVIVRDGVIENAAEWDGASPWRPPDGATAHQSDAGEIGRLWNDGAPFDPDPPPPPPEPPPPREVSPLQVRRALRQLGAIAAVNAYVATLPEEDQEAWEYAVAIPIDDQRIIAACELLQIDRDALFRLAGSFT